MTLNALKFTAKPIVGRVGIEIEATCWDATLGLCVAATYDENAKDIEQHHKDTLSGALEDFINTNRKPGYFPYMGMNHTSQDCSFLARVKASDMRAVKTYTKLLEKNAGRPCYCPECYATTPTPKEHSTEQG